jgi:hypothetical protein
MKPGSGRLGPGGTFEPDASQLQLLAIWAGIINGEVVEKEGFKESK